MAKGTLKPAVEDTDRFVLFVDNLEGQKAESFKDAVSASNGLVWYGLANATDIWQPVDAGYGKILKSLLNNIFFNG